MVNNEYLCVGWWLELLVAWYNGSAQTVDITNVKLDKDRFFKVLSTQSGDKYKYEEIDDPR